MNSTNAGFTQKELAPKVSFFPAWCKKCGNCVAFCPRKALEADKWGYPQMTQPERCTLCGLCEMLCPDFALSVGEAPCLDPAEVVSPGGPGSMVGAKNSPERLAPAPCDSEKSGG